MIALLGTGLGVSFSIVSTKSVGAMLFDIGPRDPLVLFGAPMVLAAITVCACLIPAVRVANIDPAISLRTE